MTTDVEADGVGLVVEGAHDVVVALQDLDLAMSNVNEVAVPTPAPTVIGTVTRRRTSGKASIRSLKGSVCPVGALLFITAIF